MDDCTRENSSRRMPEGGNRLVYDILSIVFLLAILSLISTVFIPKLFTASKYRREEPIDHVIPIDEDVIVIPVPIYDPGPVVGPHNTPRESKSTMKPEETTTADREESDNPQPTLPQPTVPWRQRKPHPEESDEDDLPLLYQGINSNPSNKRILYRLSEWIRPIQYNIRLIVGVKGHNGEEESSVKGSGTITFKVEGDASNLLEIHGEYFKDFTFTSLTVLNEARYISTIYQSYNDQKRTYSLLLEQPLMDGETYTLVLNWVASISHSVLGFYETWYFDGNINRYSLTTQGQPMSTRKWMPCFDEPALKAIFSLEVTHPSSLNAISNGRIISTESLTSGVNLTKTTFAETPFPISPYLYALSVTDFVEMKDTVEGIPISVILPPTHKSNLTECLQLAKRSVNSYLSALNSSRIFDKIDFVFVPDHGSAMENVGHIIFGINYLKDYSTYAHEMMHMYFGNLITLSWWDEVWINEGLATVYEIDAVHGIGTDGAINNYRKCRRKDMTDSDAFRKTIPLKFDVSTEVEAGANFKMPYNKGAVVLNMIRNVIGEKQWKEAIEHFLHKFEYQAVIGIDFITTITEVQSKYSDVELSRMTSEMAHSFFNNSGFPLVRIMRKGAKLVITQERFHRGFINGNQKENIQLWAIPLHLMSLDGTENKNIEFMTDHTLTIESNETLVVDPTKIVYYRAVYDLEVYREVAKSNLSEADKNEIVDDLLYAAYSGYVDANLAYSVYSLMENEHLQNTLKLLHIGITLLRPDHLYERYRISTGNNSKSEFVEWEANRDTTRKEDCNDTITPNDVMNKYQKNRNSGIRAFLCPQILSNHKQWIEKVIETGLDLSKQQTIHPMDIEIIIELYNRKNVKTVSNIVLKLATLIKDEFVLAKLIMRARRGLDARSTEQLSKLARIARGAARQNGVLITRLFNERHAIETEDRIIGDKLDKTFRKVFSRKLKKPSKDEKIEITEEPMI